MGSPKGLPQWQQRHPLDAFPRYGVKMATGSGKTKVMALAAVFPGRNPAYGRRIYGGRG